MFEPIVESRLVYADNPVRRERLHRQLAEVFRDHVGIAEKADAVVLRAQPNNDWEIHLGGTPKTGPMLARSARRGVEVYRFFRPNDYGLHWEAPTSMTMFPNAQFYNLVQMATKSGLEWTVAVAAE